MSTPLRRYYRGHSLVAMRDEVAGQNRYYHFDHQGTTQCLTDSAGAVTDRFAADAWGVQVKRTGTSINRHWYIGNPGYVRQVDAVSYYVRRRFMQPPAARWSSVDITRRWTPDGPYVYAGNRPALSIDPSGAVPCHPGTFRRECPFCCQFDLQPLACVPRGLTLIDPSRKTCQQPNPVTFADCLCLMWYLMDSANALADLQRNITAPPFDIHPTAAERQQVFDGIRIDPIFADVLCCHEATKCSGVVLYNTRWYDRPCDGKSFGTETRGIRRRPIPDLVRVPNTDPCIQHCIRRHESVHVAQCKRGGPIEETPAYFAGYDCLQSLCEEWGCVRSGVLSTCDPYHVFLAL